jgi:hypothetical protein
MVIYILSGRDIRSLLLRLWLLIYVVHYHDGQLYNA